VLESGNGTTATIHLPFRSADSGVTS
jgi:hypothetical protein